MKIIPEEDFEQGVQVQFHMSANILITPSTIFSPKAKAFIDAITQLALVGYQEKEFKRLKIGFMIPPTILQVINLVFTLIRQTLKQVSKCTIISPSLDLLK